MISIIILSKWWEMKLFNNIRLNIIDIKPYRFNFYNRKKLTYLRWCLWNQSINVNNRTLNRNDLDLINIHSIHRITS